MHFAFPCSTFQFKYKYPARAGVPAIAACNVTKVTQHYDLKIQKKIASTLSPRSCCSTPTTCMPTEAFPYLPIELFHSMVSNNADKKIHWILVVTK